MVKWPLIVFGFVNSYKISLFAGSGKNGLYDDTLLKSRFNEPLGVIIDEFGWMMIADSSNNVIRGIPLSSNTVYTFAGNGKAGTSNGNPTSASFNTPVDLGYSSYDKFIYVADKNNHIIRGIGLDNQVITKAGTGVPGIKNGNRLTAQFFNPSGLAVDQSGIIYVADTGNSIIRKIATDGTVSTLAGSGSPSFGDGLGTQTGFNQPIGLSIDSTGKLLYVADTGNNLIRLINMTDGNPRVSTIAGKLGPSPDSLTVDYFKSPSDVDVDSNGNLFVTDSGNAAIKKISPTGLVELLTFSESSNYNGLIFPYAIHVASLDTIYVSDPEAHKIYKISKSTTVSSSATSNPTPIITTVEPSIIISLATSTTSGSIIKSATTSQPSSIIVSLATSTTSGSIIKSATTSQPSKTSSSSPQASNTYEDPEILSNEKLIASPFFLQSDYILDSGTISHPFQISFDILITASKARRGYILAMMVGNKEYLGIYLEPYSYKLIVSMDSVQGLVRRQYSPDYSASVNLKQNQTINITIGSDHGRLLLDGSHVQDFLSYGIPSSNITIQTSPFGSTVAEASINNLAISSTDDYIIAAPTISAGSVDIVLIIGLMIGAIFFVTGLAFLGYRYRSVNISPPEANNGSVDGGQINNQATERRSRRRERSRRRAQEQNQQPEEPAPPQYTEYTDEPPPLYLSNINLFDSS